MDTIRNMKAFVAVAETGSFTKAAHQLSATLPMISRWIAELEGHLRHSVLECWDRGIKLHLLQP